MKMKNYIQPATQVALIKLQTIICISVEEGGKTSSEQVWTGADAPMRKLTTLYI